MLTTDLTVDATHPLLDVLALGMVAQATFPSWFERGVQLCGDGAVAAAEFTADAALAVVTSAAGRGGYSVAIRVHEGAVHASCDCPVAEEHRIAWCKHRVAVALEILIANTDLVLPTASQARRLLFERLRYAAFDPDANLAARRCLSAPTSSVRHLPVPGSKDNGRAACGIDLGAEVRPGDERQTLCSRCAAARQRRRRS